MINYCYFIQIAGCNYHENHLHLYIIEHRKSLAYFTLYHESKLLNA